MRRYENGRGIAARLNLMTVREILEAAGAIFATAIPENFFGPGHFRMSIPSFHYWGRQTICSKSYVNGPSAGRKS